MKLCQKILQKRLKRRHALPSAREMGKESSLVQRVKNHGNRLIDVHQNAGLNRRKNPLRARAVLVVTAVSPGLFLNSTLFDQINSRVICDRTIEFPGVLLYNKISAPSRWELIC